MRPWQVSDYSPNMGGAPPDGFTAAQLLAPNYLAGRPWEEGYTGPVTLDADDLEGSFRARFGHSIRDALRDVAPGFDPGAGPITTATLAQRVLPEKQRAPAKDDGFIPLALLAIPTAGILAFAAAGGTVAAGAGQSAAALSAKGAATAAGLSAAQAAAAGGVAGLTAQQIASAGQGALKLAGAAAPALAQSALASQLSTRATAAPIAVRAPGGADFQGVDLMTEGQQQRAPQSNSGAVPPTFISGAGTGGAVLIAIALIAIAFLAKG